ncbi:MAG: EamA family transporter [Pseudomonadota bacterium]
MSYLCVVMVWSTTPMAIVVSNQSMSASASVMCRMTLALIVIAVIVSVAKPNAALKLTHWKIYLAAGFGIFPNMSFVYVAAQYIPSGLIALIFALNPIFSAVFASALLKEPLGSVRKLFAIGLALIGLSIIFNEHVTLDSQSWIGISLILLSTVAFSFSQVCIKACQQEGTVNAMEQTLGALLFAVPGLIITWLCVEGIESGVGALQMSVSSGLAVVYLAVIGTVIGFMAYFYVLSQISVAVVSLIPLITPVMALWLGSFFLDEVVTNWMMLGTVFILTSLLMYGDLVTLAVNRARRFIRS